MSWWKKIVFAFSQFWCLARRPSVQTAFFFPPYSESPISIWTVLSFCPWLLRSRTSSQKCSMTVPLVQRSQIFFPKIITLTWPNCLKFSLFHFRPRRSTVPDISQQGRIADRWSSCRWSPGHLSRPPHRRRHWQTCRLRRCLWAGARGRLRPPASRGYCVRYVALLLQHTSQS